MNPMFFGLKRAYHCALRIGRLSFAALKLTAARFDLLYALTDEGEPRGGATYQSVLRRMLGVSRPTVSRMLRSLEEPGLVERRRSDVDRRQLEVSLTYLGVLRVRNAYEALVSSGWSDGAPYFDKGWTEPTTVEESRREHCLSEMDAFEQLLDDVRVTFRDFATLAYRWYVLDH
jgi:DNA-binding MarR family transcriptional regulator